MNQVFAQPVGSGSNIQRPPISAPLAYMAGLILGAVTTAVATAFGASTLAHGVWPRAVIWGVAVVMIGMGVRGQYLGRISPLPERRRQVPTRWLMWRRRAMTAAAFGCMLGMGVWTLLHHAAAYVVLGCLLLVDPVTALLVGLAYGVTRGMLLLTVWATSVGTPRWHMRLTFLRVPAVERVLPHVAVLVGVAIPVLYFFEGR